MASNLSCEAVVRAALGGPTKRAGAELLWHCPRHEDKHESLSVNPKKNAWLCGPCGASGNAWALAAFLANVDPGDKRAVKGWLKEGGLLNGGKRKVEADGRGPCVARYTYTDADGNPVARKLRFEPGENGKKKSFAWERFEGGQWLSALSNVKTPLYRLTEIKTSDSVVLTEGEKDADAGARIGLPTTTSGGTDSWREDHSEALRGKPVVIVADADEPGRAHAHRLAASLHPKAKSVKVCEVPGAKDLAEAIGKRMTRETLLALFEQAPEWKPVSGAEILDSVMGFIRRFVSLTESQARVASLWVAHTHAMETAEFTPYLDINSAEKESGKTRLLEVLKVLVANPWGTENASAPAMVRKIHGGFETGKPVKPVTVLFDERDSQAGADKERAEAIRGILNSGYERGGCYSRCVGEGAKMAVVDFSTFGAKALAGIGRVTDTVESRSVPIRMKRARRGEVAKFRRHGQEGRKILGEGAELKARLAVWCAANLKALANAQPEVPDALSDRQADVCEPLLAIGDAAGGDWPEAARAALVKLCGEAQADDQSPRVRLLQDARCIFADKQVNEITSVDLCGLLNQIEEGPWGDWSKGKPLSPAKLARLLKPFEIYPRQIKNGQARGYRLSDFQEGFSLYLPCESVEVSETRENSGDSEGLKVSTESPVDTFKNAVSPAKNAGGGHIDTLKAGIEAEEGKKAVVEWEA